MSTENPVSTVQTHDPDAQAAISLFQDIITKEAEGKAPDKPAPPAERAAPARQALETSDEEEDVEAVEEEDEDEEAPAPAAITDDDREVEFDALIDGKQVTVKVNGKELKEGYIRASTFHQRLNKLHEYHKAVDGAKAEAGKVREQYIGLVTQAEEQLSALIPKEPDWPDLYSKDPKGAAELHRNYIEHTAKLNNLRKVREQAIEEKNREQENETAAFAQREYSHFIETEGFQTTQEIDEAMKAMVNVALEAGFTQDEIRKVYDSRMLRVLRLAAKYVPIRDSKPTVVKVGKRAMKPGAEPGSPETAPKTLTQRVKRFQRSGLQSDAIAMFEPFTK